MKRLIEQRYVLRHNLVTIIGFCLAFYFTYHMAFGQRSLMRLMSLERAIAHISAEYEDVHAQRLALEDRVIRMRPGSLDRDLLEERVRYMLGYAYPDEQIIIQTN